MDIVSILKKYGLTNEKSIQELAVIGTIRHYKKNECIVHIDQPLSDIHLLVSGIIKGCYYTKDGEETVDALVNDFGFVLCSYAEEIIREIGTREEYIAVTPVTTISFPRTQVHAILHNDEYLNQFAASRTSLGVKYHLDMVRMFKVYHGFDLYLYHTQKNPLLVANVKRNDLAKWLNVDVRSIGLWKKRLKEEYFEIYEDLESKKNYY